jgi:hypothetical protein
VPHPSTVLSWKGGNHEPQHAVFFFKSFAENYYPLAHTIQEKGSAMGGIRKEQKQGAARFQTPVFRLFPRFLRPETRVKNQKILWKSLFRPENAYNMLEINILHFGNVNERVTENP